METPNACIINPNPPCTYMRRQGCCPVPDPKDITGNCLSGHLWTAVYSPAVLEPARRNQQHRPAFIPSSPPTGFIL